jgi:hypothetical protein
MLDDARKGFSQSDRDPVAGDVLKVALRAPWLRTVRSLTLSNSLDRLGRFAMVKPDF